MKKDRRKFIKQTSIASFGVASMGIVSDFKFTINESISDLNNTGSDQINWNVFDANCMVGRHLKWDGKEVHNIDDLVSEMNHYAISEALVIDCLSRENHPYDGNIRILDRTKSNSRLYPAWSVIPSIFEETGRTPEIFVKEMEDNDVRAVFLFTNQFFFNLYDWCIDPLAEKLAEKKIPVFINPVQTNGVGSSDSSDWDGIIALCKRWPDLPVIVSEGRIRRSQRLFYKALDVCPNLHLELSAYWLHRGIEFVTERWGPERMIFGSGWPKYGQHMTLVSLTTAQIDDEDKRKIAGDNLRKLLSWNQKVHDNDITFGPSEDIYVEYGRTGVRPKELSFYDVHGHLGEYNAHYHTPDSQLKKIVEDLNYYGIEKVCVFSFSGVYSDEVFGNDIIAEAVEKYPERFIGFTLLNPLRGEENMIAELERGEENGMKGIKLIPAYQGYPTEGPLIDVACKWAHDHCQIILNHDWGGPLQMERLLNEYPNACFVAGHSYRAISYANFIRKYPNLFICSVPIIKPGECENIIESIGADRLLFGTDLLDLPIGWNLGPVLFARIKASEKEKILNGNLKNILTRYSN